MSAVEQIYAQMEKECLAASCLDARGSHIITRREKVTIESDYKPLQSIFKKSGSMSSRKNDAPATEI